MSDATYDYETSQRSVVNSLKESLPSHRYVFVKALLVFTLITYAVIFLIHDQDVYKVRRRA